MLVCGRPCRRRRLFHLLLWARLGGGVDCGRSVGDGGLRYATTTTTATTLNVTVLFFQLFNSWCDPGFNSGCGQEVCVFGAFFLYMDGLGFPLVAGEARREWES